VQIVCVYGPADAIAILLSVVSLKSSMVLPFWCWLTQCRCYAFSALMWLLGSPKMLGFINYGTWLTSSSELCKLFRNYTVIVILICHYYSLIAASC